jgi:hypothetical protein
MLNSARQSSGASTLKPGGALTGAAGGAAPPQQMTTRQGTNPLVRQLGLAEIIKRDEQAKAIEAPAPVTHEPAISALAGHVRKAWSDNKLAKEKISMRLLNCLRARRGIFSPADIAQYQDNNQGGGNMVWAPLTEVKCRAASAWIREIVLPPGERPWKLRPTPMPNLPLPLKRSIVNKALQQAQQVMTETAQAGGGILGPEEFRDLARDLGEKLKGDTEKQLERIALKRAKRMEEVIADRMSEGGFNTAMDGFVEDFCTYPAAILKGPVYTRHKTLTWGEGFQPEVSNAPAQAWERVSPFDAYPAPSSMDCQVGDFIERVRFRRNALHDLKGVPGYRDDQIDAALMDYSAGHLEGWLWNESERQRLEQDSLYMWMSPDGVIDALNYWGSVPGWQLKSWGVTGKKGEDLEDTRDYECNVLLCGSYVLYASLNPHPLDMRPYHKACYDEVPGAFWGRAIPELAETSQKMCNYLASSLADNISIASGPQVWVHSDRFADGETSVEVHPWRVWQLKSDASQGVNPGIGFVQPDDRSAALMAAYEKWEIRADDATGIPRYTYGNERAGGSADTATGLSMLMNNAAKGLRRAIGSVDAGVMEPTTYMAFINEMVYNPDQSIKGDCTVQPWGAAAILIKESAQQRRIQFLGMTANPIDSAILGTKGRAALLRETAESMDFDVDAVPDDEALDKQMQEQSQQAAAAAQAEAEAKIAIENARGENAIKLERTRQEGADQKVEADTMAEIIKKAVESAMAAQKPKSITYKSDDKGNVVGATAE